MARECLRVLLMRWLKAELAIFLLLWRMSSETAQLYKEFDILRNMASLADVGWKLLEFKARSKRSGLIHLHAWHRTWAKRSSVVLCQWLCEADGLYSLWTRGKIDLSFPFNLSSSLTEQARKVRGVNVQHHWAILSVSPGLSRCYYISPLFTVANCLHLVWVHGLWWLEDHNKALVVTLTFPNGEGCYCKTSGFTC